MIIAKTLRFVTATLAIATCAFAIAPASVSAYDGTNCESPGNCWEPKPGYPAKIEGSKYDPQHDPKELVKSEKTIAAMEARNAKRVQHYKETGKWVYDVSKIK